MASINPIIATKDNEAESSEKTILNKTTKKISIAKNREPIIQAHYLIFKTTIAEQHVNELSDETIREHLEWLEEAAAFGFPHAQFDLAMAYQVGNVVPANPTRTMVWLKLASTSKLGQHEEAKRILEDIKINKPGFDGQKEQKMIESAIQIYFEELAVLERREEIHLKPIFSRILTQVLEKEAAESGNPNVQNELAQRYGNGVGIEKNRTFGNALLKNAAAGGCVHAQIALAHGLSTDRKDNHDTTLAKDDTEAFKWYQAAALQKDSHGEYWLADCYFKGKGVVADQALGKKWLLASAAHGCALAQYELSKCNFEGKKGFAIDLSAALFWATKASTNTDPLAAAQLLLGSFYEKGLVAKASNNINDMGVLVLEKNLESACFCYNLAALGGHPDARQALLNVISLDPSLDKKFQEGSHHAKEPVRKNAASSPEAFKVSEISSFIVRSQYPYRNSRFPTVLNLKKLEEIRKEAQSLPSSAVAKQEKPDDVKATKDLVNNELLILRKHMMLVEFYRASMLDFKADDSSIWIEEAAAIGNVEAILDLIRWYEKNELLSALPERVVFLLEQGIQKGATAAQGYLDNYKEGAPDVFNNLKKETITPNALKLYDEELSNLKGKSLIKPIFSICMFRAVMIQASEKNDPKSQCELSYRYRTGIGCEKDLKAFRYWLTKSAENNFDIAQIMLAHYLSSNPNLSLNYRKWISEKDDQAAFHWYEKAATLDCTEAATWLASSYLEGRGIQKDNAKGIEWLEKSAKENVEAQWELYLCYSESRHGIKKDKILASKWLIKTAENDESSYSIAPYTLGYNYEHGVSGFTINLPLAYYWYNKAALLKYKDAENALIKLQNAHSKKISEWARTAAIKSKSALSKTASSKNITVSENDSENSAQVPRDWLREQDLASKPRTKNADRSAAGQQPKNKTRSIFKSGLLKPTDLSVPRKTTAKKSPSEDGSQKPALITIHTIDREAEALKLKLEKEKEEAVLKERCNMLYFEFFLFPSNFLS